MIKDYIVFRKHLCISFELLSIDLYEFIKNNNFRGVSLGLIRRFAIQILQALKFTSQEKIIHWDLKPENILLKNINKSGIKLIDFGSSCFENERIYTYIQSRFYRAPEIILGIPYTPAIDIWSFGWILAELYSGYPLFPGESEQDQLGYIMEICGVPPKNVLTQATRRKIFFDEDFAPILKPNARGKVRRPYTKSLSNVLQCQDKGFVRFLKGWLAWDPEERFSPTEALMNDWVLEGLPPKVLVQHKKMLGIKDFPGKFNYFHTFLAQKEDINNKTQNLIENLLAFSGDGNKSHRSHRRKVSNHQPREFSNKWEEKLKNNSKNRVITNNWIENPYQDILENKKHKATSFTKKKEFFAHTDNNLKGISNLVKDDDLIIRSTKAQNNSHNSSSNETKINNCYFYPQKFTKHENHDLPDFGGPSAL